MRAALLGFVSLAVAAGLPLAATAQTEGGKAEDTLHSEDTLRAARPADTLQPMKPLDVYFYNTKTGDKALVQVTNTPNAAGSAGFGSGARSPR